MDTVHNRGHHHGHAIWPSLTARCQSKGHIVNPCHGHSKANMFKVDNYQGISLLHVYFSISAAMCNCMALDQPYLSCHDPNYHPEWIQYRVVNSYTDACTQKNLTTLVAFTTFSTRSPGAIRSWHVGTTF